MKRLLIGYDGSECANAALDELRLAGLPAQLEVKVVTIADVWLPSASQQSEPIFPDFEPKVVRRARAQALQALKDAENIAASGRARVQKLYPTWRAKSVATADSPPWAVCRLARQWRANLIVVGSHGRSVLERMFLGSVAQKIAAEAHCSVRIGRPRLSPKRRDFQVMVAVDGSPDSQSAIENVIGRSWPAKTVVRLVTVIDHRLQSAVAWPSGYAREWVVRHDKEAREWACRMVEQQAKRLHEAGLRVETYIYDGDPKQNLLKAAKDLKVDCIFIGAHGVHHAGQFGLGAVASAIAARAHYSVEIVRTG